MSRKLCYGEQEGLVEACANMAEQERFLYKGCVACADCVAQLETLAYTDALTGLPNQRAAVKRFESLRAEERPIGLLFFDFENFKLVNDSRSHRTGDDLLKTGGLHLAQHLQEARGLRADDMLAARKGGDEFIVVLALDSIRRAVTLDETERLEAIRHSFIDNFAELPEVQAYNHTVADPAKRLGLRAGASIFDYDNGMSFEDLVETAEPSKSAASPVSPVR